jgi:hypothetical protein
MSAGGVLIDLPEAAAVGSTVELAIQWPGIYHGRQVVRLLLTACVSRVDSRGTAMQILSHQFRDVHSEVVLPAPRERRLAAAS